MIVFGQTIVKNTVNFLIWLVKKTQSPTPSALGFLFLYSCQQKCAPVSLMLLLQKVSYCRWNSHGTKQSTKSIVVLDYALNVELLSKTLVLLIMLHSNAFLNDKLCINCLGCYEKQNPSTFHTN